MNLIRLNCKEVLVISVCINNKETIYASVENTGWYFTYVLSNISDLRFAIEYKKVGSVNELVNLVVGAIINPIKDLEQYHVSFSIMKK